VLVAAGKPQRYGTQYDMVDGKLQPAEIEDPEHVDARRAEVDLGTMAEYDRMIQANTKR
jgi:hypothetical protein